MKLVVVSTDGPALLGQDLPRKTRLDWSQVNRVSEDRGLSELLKQYKSVFPDELGTVITHRAKLQLHSSAVPKFFKPRPVPFAIKDVVGAELNRLKIAGILEKVSCPTVTGRPPL